MKLIFTLIQKKTLTILAASLLMLTSTIGYSQISLVCTDPSNTVYGLTGNGEIYEINSNTAATIKVVKNGTYLGNAPKSSNGLGYNSFSTKFYYFKRNVKSAPQEFVSFSPLTNTVTVLAASTCTDDIHTGCVSFDGTGYYTIDIQGTMHYYNILANTWTFITSKIVDQNGNNVTNIIKTQNAGDMAIDGLGNIWLVTSSNTNYALYKFPASLPTTPVAQFVVTRVIDPTAVTPTGNSFAGIAFKPNGQVLMATKNDNKLYLLQNTSTLTFVGNFGTNDVGNDLTSCSFPTKVLPVTWKSFDITVQNNNMVVLNWEVVEYQNKAFYVEYSANGSDWEELAFIPGKNDPSAPQDYTYSHINNLDGKQYYRIKQVDMDERASYSEVKTITLKNDKQTVTVFPNPATDHVRIMGNGKVNLAKAQIFDLSGRMIAEKKLQSGANTVMINELPAGTYIVRVETNTGTVYNQKIIKQ